MDAVQKEGIIPDLKLASASKLALVPPTPGFWAHVGDINSKRVISNTVSETVAFCPALHNFDKGGLNVSGFVELIIVSVLN